MTATSNSLIAGYARELLQTCVIPNVIIQEICRFLKEHFPHLFVIRDRNYFSSNESGVRGVEYLDMHLKISTYLNILDINTNCFNENIYWNVFPSGFAVIHNFEMSPQLRKLLPANAGEYYSQCTSVIFKVGRNESSVIIIDRNSIYSSDVVNGYQIQLPDILYIDYQLAYDSFDSDLYVFSNYSTSSSKTILSRMSFNICQNAEEIKENNCNNNENIISGLQWNTVSEQYMLMNNCRIGSLLFIPNKMSNNTLMFVSDQKSYLFPLQYLNKNNSNGNSTWIDIKDSNFNKSYCGMCFDSIHNCVYAGSGYLGYNEMQRNIDLYDFHKNEWYADIIPEIDVDDDRRMRPKFWMQNQLLFIGGGGESNIPDVIFIDLRENKKQWDVFENQWNEYFVMKKQDEIVVQFCEETIDIHLYLSKNAFGPTFLTNKKCKCF